MRFAFVLALLASCVHRPNPPAAHRVVRPFVLAGPKAITVVGNNYYVINAFETALIKEGFRVGRIIPDVSGKLITRYVADIGSAKSGCDENVIVNVYDSQTSERLLTFAAVLGSGECSTYVRSLDWIASFLRMNWKADEPPPPINQPMEL